jgi:hypothetical protein
LIPKPCLRAANICEGLDHADAGPLDVAAATEQLRIAVRHELARRRARDGAAAAAKAAAAAGPAGAAEPPES